MHVAHSSIAKLPSWEGIAFQSKSRAGVIVGADPRGLKALQWGLSGRHQHHHAAGWGRQSPAISPCITYYAAAAGHWQCWAQRPMWVTVWGTSVQRAPSQRPSSHSSPLSTTSTCFNRSSCLGPPQQSSWRGNPSAVSKLNPRVSYGAFCPVGWIRSLKNHAFGGRGIGFFFFFLLGSWLVVKKKKEKKRFLRSWEQYKKAGLGETGSPCQPKDICLGTQGC